MDQDTNTDGLTLAAWLDKVDHELVHLCDMPHDCLADFPIWDLWNDDVSPAEAAYICLVEWNDFPSDLIEESR